MSAMEVILATLLLATLCNAAPSNEGNANPRIFEVPDFLGENSMQRSGKSLTRMRMIPVPRDYLQELADKAVELHEHISAILQMSRKDDVMPMILIENDRPITTLMTEDTQKQVIALQNRPMADPTGAEKPAKKPILPWFRPAKDRPPYVVALDDGPRPNREPIGHQLFGQNMTCPTWMGEICDYLQNYLPKPTNPV